MTGDARSLGARLALLLIPLSIVAVLLADARPLARGLFAAAVAAIGTAMGLAFLADPRNRILLDEILRWVPPPALATGLPTRPARPTSL